MDTGHRRGEFNSKVIKYFQQNHSSEKFKSRERFANIRIRYLEHQMYKTLCQFIIKTLDIQSKDSIQKAVSEK